jgi:hypothetical protein
MATPHIEAIFIAAQAGGAMTRVHEIEAIARSSKARRWTG